MPNTSAFSSATSSVASWSYSSWRKQSPLPIRSGSPVGGWTNPLWNWQMSGYSIPRLLIRTRIRVLVLATQDHEGSWGKDPVFLSWVLLSPPREGGESKGAGHRSRFTVTKGFCLSLIIIPQKAKKYKFLTCLFLLEWKS